MGLRALLRASAERRRPPPLRLPAHRPAAEGHAVRRARARLPALSPRALRGVQPGLGSGDALRPAVRRAHGIDPDVPAAAGALALRLAPGAGHAGGPSLRGVPPAAGLGGRVTTSVS